MKKYHWKKVVLVVMSILLCSIIGACSYEYETLEVEGSKTNINSADETVVLEEAVENGEEQPDQTMVVDEIPVTGEDFSLICTYDTGDYPLNKWRVTSNKTVNMTVNTSPLPEGYTVHIEHVHADIILKSTDSQVDGITQDTMDDSDHRTPTKGFYVDETFSYNNIFSIEGYTDQFYTIWGHVHGNYGHISSEYKRLSEQNLREMGTYAEKLCVVYDIVISTPDCEDGYVKSVYSEVLIPLGDLVVTKKDILTGTKTEKVYRSPLLDE